MHAVNYLSNGPTESDLERVAEPLVNYICATDEPNAALLSALAVLCQQVNATNGMATNQFRRLLDRR